MGRRSAGLKALPRIFCYLWQAAPGTVISAIVCRIAAAVIPLGVLYISKQIIDMLVGRRPGGSTGPLWMLLGAEFVLVAFASFCSRAIDYCDLRIVDEFSRTISLRVMDHAANLDLASLEDPEFHDKLERARVQATDRAVMFSSVGQLLQAVVMMVVLASAAAAYSPWMLAVLVLCTIPAFTGESYFTFDAYALARDLTPIRRELDYLRVLSTSRDSAKEIRVFGLGDYLQKRYRARSHQVISLTRRHAGHRLLWASILNLIASAGYYTCYITLVLEAWAGRISIGTLTFLAGAVAGANSQLQLVFTQFSHVSEQALYLTDLVDFLDEKPTIYSKRNALPLPRPIRRGLEFRDVSFHYPGSRKMVLDHLNLTIMPGEHVALVGENGEGKTTLVKLLARLYEPTGGQILLDGIDLREYELNDLRHEVGIIFQDFYRYDFPVRENIGTGRIECIHDDEALWDAARRSGADEIVTRLPRQMEQMLGLRFEGGVDLSGGQWQRIALARAYIRDAQILILDEPTAALDAAAEAEVFSNFRELMGGRTALLISHRFSTVRMADRILVLANGRIAEEGNHQDLTAAGGRYARLFELQAANYR
ncbi:MAG TPA: ABC transporter ATP-binding protein [Bryobacteraceae bacterium]|nr:ABC transporter ATP-binding protein [Bryobacteraceae bacterium]